MSIPYLPGASPSDPLLSLPTASGTQQGSAAAQQHLKRPSRQDNIDAEDGESSDAPSEIKKKVKRSSQACVAVSDSTP